MTACLGKLCGRIPYSKTAAFFNRDSSSIAKDVLTFDLALRHSTKTREQADALRKPAPQNLISRIPDIQA
jgi:hypothetical protein